jgi:oligopeptide transport system ATP-binding protein
MENGQKYSSINYPFEVGPLPSGKEIKLSVRNLAISFLTDEGRVQAVRGVSFDLYKGETLCIVGESGSGKSVTSKTIMGILPASAHIDSGSITFEGENLTKIAEDDFHRIRGTKIGMIFQDPLSSLNPIMKIGRQITEVMITNGNHLKHQYDEIINDELTAYKNHQRLLELAKGDLKFEVESQKIAFKKAKAKAANDFDAGKGALASDLKSKDASRVDPAKTKLAALKKAESEAVAEASKKRDEADRAARAKYEAEKNRLNPIIAADRAALKAKRKVAEAAVKKTKAEIVARHKNLRKPILDRLFSFKNFAKDYADFITERRRFVSELRVTHKEAKRRALKIMEEVGISEPERRFNQYPFEFSGGMRQRIVIAIALTADPEVLICDEPTTALDVTIQAQILELINKLKAARHMSVIFITHDLGVVANMADRVAVMYAGKIVEYGTSYDVFYHPAHPYTWALLSSIPDVDSKERLEAIPGTPPNMLFPPKGDAFAWRSKYALGIDFRQEPPMFQLSETHYASSWLLDERAPKAIMPKIVSTRIENSKKKAGKDL